MSNIQQMQIQRIRDFDVFFPDLFLNNVPKHYSVPDVYSSFNHLGDGIVSKIIIVPGGQYNQFVVKFHSFNIPQHTYDRTICMRWPFYTYSLSSEPDTSYGWLEFENVSVFNSNKWHSQEQYGVEHDYSLYDEHSILQRDPRSVHLHKYLKETHFSCTLTDDAIDFLIQENMRIERDANGLHEYLSGNSDAAADAAPAELEDGEIDEGISAYHNYYNNYIYKIAEDTLINDESSAATVADEAPTEFAVVDDNRNICIANEDLYSIDSDSNDDDDECHPQEDNDTEDDNTIYEYCEITNGVWHRRAREDYEDPDELHYRINNATNPHDRADAFWN
jgi:hypothetical protein